MTGFDVCVECGDLDTTSIVLISSRDATDYRLADRVEQRPWLRAEGRALRRRPSSPSSGEGAPLRARRRSPRSSRRRSRSLSSSRATTTTNPWLVAGVRGQPPASRSSSQASSHSGGALRTRPAFSSRRPVTSGSSRRLTEVEQPVGLDDRIHPRQSGARRLRGPHPRVSRRHAERARPLAHRRRRWSGDPREPRRRLVERAAGHGMRPVSGERDRDHGQPRRPRCRRSSPGRSSSASSSSGSPRSSSNAGAGPRPRSGGRSVRSIASCGIAI